MKKIYLLSAAALLGLASCSDYDDQFHLGNQITDVKNGTPITLADADYAAIANLAANKAIAAQLDQEDGGTTVYSDALAEVGSKKYFNTLATADLYIPAFIQSKYPHADLGSTFNVTYNDFAGASMYLADFNNLKGEYTLSADDYATAWDGKSSATYLTPATVGKLPELLAASHADATEGDIIAVNYAYSGFEPAGGSETPADNYAKISDVVANTAGGEYSVKGIVCATYSRGFLLTDNTGYILVYKTADVKIGDEVAVSGTTSAYGGLMQFPNTSEVEIVKAGKEPNFKHPSPKVLTGADFDAYCAAPYVAYVSFIGKLTISGNYYNVAVEGTEKVGSLANVPAGMVDESLNGQYILVTGYAIGATGSGGKYLNVMLTGVSGAPNAIKAKMMARAAAASANKSAVYTYANGKWTEYKTDEAKVIAAQPEWYDLIGSNTIAKHSQYLPTLLQRYYPFAEDGEKVTVVYRKSSSAMDAVEYTYSATSGWGESKIYKPETTSFSKTENGYEAQISTYLNETLLGEPGGFMPFDVNLNTLSYVWSNTTSYGWKASAYASKTNVESESWLVSPAINFKKAKNPEMVFDEAMNFLGSNNIEDFLSVKVSTDFDGTDVTKATWQTLNISGRAAGDSWTFFTVSPVSLSQFVGNTIYIAFVYKSTNAVAPTYEFKNIIVREKEEAEQ